MSLAAEPTLPGERARDRATTTKESVTGQQETPETASVKADEAPEQFKRMRESLHAERDRVKAMSLDWRPSLMRDVRDTRSPQLLGETLLRMQSSLGSLAERQDLLEGIR